MGLSLSHIARTPDCFPCSFAVHFIFEEQHRGYLAMEVVCLMGNSIFFGLASGSAFRFVHHLRLAQDDCS